MGMDDFFKKVDEKITKLEDSDNQAKQAREDNKEFLAALILRLTPIIKEYEKNLIQRNIKAKAVITTASITLELNFKDGGHWNLYMGENSNFTGAFSFIRYFTNDDGKSYSSTDGTSYSQTTWKDEYFTAKVEANIRDFIYYSDRHGGF